MYDSVKTTKNAKLIIYFIDENIEKGPQSFTILDQTKAITKDQSKYEIDLKDNSMNDNKIYECFLQFESEKISYYIKVNYGQDNYYFFGRNKNNMCLEFIFADFVNKNIDTNKCFIKYNGKQYFAFDDKNFLCLRCLNLININLDLLELPVSYENKIIPKSIFDSSSFSIFISVAEKEQKIYEICLSMPFLEKDQKLTAKEIQSKLQDATNNVQNVLCYDKKKTFDEYFDDVDMKKVPTIYANEIKNSVKLEEEILPFFSFYRPNLTDDEILAFEAYSNFMITFPSFKHMKRQNPKLNTFPFIKQHYYSHKVIENFIETLPSELPKTERVYLIYSACRCLRNLLNNGVGTDEKELFYFCDLNNSDNIYNEVENFNEKFIDNITEKSEMYLFLLQINSGSGINKLTNDLTAKFSMLKAEQIKEHLRNSLPNHIIRVNYFCGFLGLTFNEAMCTVISEKDIFGTFFSKKELKGGDTDEKYNRRLILSNVMQHERFGHIIFSMNFYSFKQDKGNIYMNEYEDDEPSSPRQFYQITKEENKQKEKLIEIVEILTNKSEDNVKKGESGMAFNVFLTRGDENNMNILTDRESDFSKIFKRPELFASEDLTDLNILIKDSAAEIELSCPKYKKISEGKYEHITEKKLYIDRFPTTAKYSY